jgi:hypothetical protein
MSWTTWPGNSRAIWDAKKTEGQTARHRLLPKLRRSRPSVFHFCERRQFRFPCEVCRCVHRASDRAGSHRVWQWRHTRRGLPPSSTASAPRSGHGSRRGSYISRLNTWPARPHRASRDSEWGTPVNLGPAINSASPDLAPNLSIDGHLLFGSNRAGGQGRFDIYVSRRSNPNDDSGWVSPTNAGPPSYLHGHSGLLRASSRHSRQQGAIVEQRV